MRQGTKIVVAATVTWIAAAYGYDAISNGFEPPWDRREEGEFFALCIMPPIVALLGFWLFRWALGRERFTALITGNKSHFVSALLFILLLVAVVNGRTAAHNAESAYRMASRANDNSIEAASNAEDAAREASDAEWSCTNRR